MKPGQGSVRLGASVLVAILAAGCAHQQKGGTPTPRAPRPGEAVQRPGGAGQEAGGGRGGARPAQPRPYAQVITADAQTRAGLFKTHRIGDKLFFEIPRGELDKDMILLVRTVAGTGRQSTLYVRWEREGTRVLLREVDYSIMADSSKAIHREVDAQALGPIIAAFNVESWGPDSAAVVDVTKLYTSNVSELAAVTNPQADRSFIQHVAAFPENIEVEGTQTGVQQGNQGGAPPGGRAGGAPRSRTQSAVVHWSMLKLPEHAMMPRYEDDRVGYISSSTIDYGSAEHEAHRRRVIHRFRLEKKDPSAAISDPVEPIVYWIDPATPKWLVPWVKSGIEAWRPAFEAAGFRNAIVGRLAPTPEEDPDWSMYDARHSMVYWRPSTVANANGGQQVDPRTGEIIRGEVQIFHNVLSLQRSWYFIQAGALDPRATQLPMSDSLMGALIEYVVTHEIGHSIGFPHNMKASSQYPADSIRSASFLRRMGGHVATLMDYSRFNYVAQPEDHIPVELLIPHVGPYDRYAVKWGYAPIPGAHSPEDELPTLNAWAQEQDTVPWFRFSTPDATADPGNLTEAVGDADAVKSSTLALKNLARVVKKILPSAERPGKDYALVNDLYGEAVTQWGRYNGHVAAIVGGADTQERYGTGRRFKPLAKEKQHAALVFLDENAFHVPPYLLDPDILYRIEQDGAIDRVRSAQARVLNSLLSESRMRRLIEYEAIEPRGQTYTVAELLGDLRRGVWEELSVAKPRIDVYRRNLQRAYLESAERLINPPPPTPQQEQLAAFLGQSAPRYPSDVRPAMRGELAELDRAVLAAAGRTSDSMTRLHLRDVHMEIKRILETPAVEVQVNR